YFQDASGKLEPLKTQGIDTGMGLERLAMVAQKKKSIFETDLFEPLFKKISTELLERVRRIMADHSRAIAFLISDGVQPSNKEGGYVLRRLMRRVITYAHQHNIKTAPEEILETVVSEYAPIYSNLDPGLIRELYTAEYVKYTRSVEAGLKVLNK